MKNQRNMRVTQTIQEGQEIVVNWYGNVMCVEGNSWPELILTGWLEGKKEEEDPNEVWKRSDNSDGTIQTIENAQQTNLAKSD